MNDTYENENSFLDTSNSRSNPKYNREKEGYRVVGETESENEDDGSFIEMTKRNPFPSESVMPSDDSEGDDDDDDEEEEEEEEEECLDETEGIKIKSKKKLVVESSEEVEKSGEDNNNDDDQEESLNDNDEIKPRSKKKFVVESSEEAERSSEDDNEHEEVDENDDSESVKENSNASINQIVNETDDESIRKISGKKPKAFVIDSTDENTDEKSETNSDLQECSEVEEVNEKEAETNNIKSIHFNDSHYKQSLSKNKVFDTPISDNNELNTIDDTIPIEEPSNVNSDSPSFKSKNEYQLKSLSEKIAELPDILPIALSNRNDNRKKSSPEIVVLSDSEAPSTPLRQPTNKIQKRVTEYLVKAEKQLSSFSPNFDRYTPRTQQRIKLEEIKKKMQNNEPLERKMKMMEIKDEPMSKNIASALDNNPSKLDKNDLRARVAQGLNLQQTNRNYGYEERLRSIIDPMMEYLDQKPNPDQNFDDFVSPNGLKVKLLPHQCYSMQWLKWREAEHPNGAILADDMGLGKTLTVLAYLRLVKDIYEKRAKDKMQENEEEEEEEEKEEDFDERKYLKTMKNKKKNRMREKLTSKRLKTLVVLPASLLHQWQGEIDNKFEKNSFKVHVYHEANRKKHSYNLDDNDIVFTTYEIVSREISVPDKEGVILQSDSPLANIKWKRIILDEAHRIKNHSTKANKAMCLLKAKYRIAITGTPIHNSLNDLYSLIKFLHFDPMNDFGLWKYLFPEDKKQSEAKKQSQVAIEREKRTGHWLKLLSDYLILRRTKKDKFIGTDKCIVDLPEKHIEEVRFKLNAGENIIYGKIFEESKQKVNEFLNNQHNKLIGKITSTTNNLSAIFVYLLRLRQACCHMSLLSECLDKDELKNHQFEHEGVEGMMENMTLADKSSIEDSIDAIKEVKSENLAECLKKSYMSSKIDKSIAMITNILEEYPEDKLIVVSQWTSMLSIIGNHLRKRDLKYCEIRGDVKLFVRNEIVESFNDKSNTDLRVMLLSLTAGGVGLNLVGANRMFLLDIHWNPALEQQCADRIYRVGQKKNVTIYKLLCEQTIEERIQQIQQGKIQIAEKVCRSGAESAVPGMPGNAKLNSNDLRLLFSDFPDKSN